MMISKLQRLAMLLLSAATVIVLNRSAAAELYLNEIYFDPPGSAGDADFEYIELRGTPSMSLANHYLIFIEAEDTIAQTGGAGKVEHIFDLGACSAGACAVGPSGFLALRQRNDHATNQFTVVAGATDLANTGTGDGWGNGATSTVFSSDDTSDGVSGQLENGGWTAMLIHNVAGTAPALNEDLDVGNNGLDVPTGKAGWEILDSVGQLEGGEQNFGQWYAPIMFGNGVLPAQDRVGIGPSMEPGAVYVNLGYEVEYLGRWADSTGQTAKDWHVSNLTDNGLASFTASGDFRQSGSDEHGYPRPDGETEPTVHESESNQFAPYGTNLTSTIGAGNYPLNQTSLPWDYNHNGVVDAADYSVWRDTLGTVWIEGSGQSLPDPNTNPNPSANADLDRSVDLTDYKAWKYHFDEAVVGPPGGAGSFAVPEPASWMLALVGLAAFAARRCAR